MQNPCCAEADAAIARVPSFELSPDPINAENHDRHLLILCHLHPCSFGDVSDLLERFLLKPEVGPVLDRDGSGAVLHGELYNGFEPLALHAAIDAIAVNLE